MGFPIAQRVADAYDENGTVLPRDEVFALLWRAVGIEAAQFLGMDEVELFGQAGDNLRVALINHVLRAYHGGIDLADSAGEEADVAILRAYGLFPVPLVHVEGVEVAQFLIGTDGVHVGVYAIAGRNVVFGEGEAFPFGEGVDDFCLPVAQILDWERDGAFAPAEVIVDAHSLQHKEGGGYPPESEFGGEVELEELFDSFDAQFGLWQVEQRLVSFRLYQVTHVRVFF